MKCLFIEIRILYRLQFIYSKISWLNIVYLNITRFILKTGLFLKKDGVTYFDNNY